MMLELSAVSREREGERERERPSLIDTYFSIVFLSLLSVPNRIWSDPFPNMVRLREGEYSNEGIVEVYCSGQWGTICTNGPLSNVLAGTLCRQLGYTSVANSTIM